MNFLIQNKNKSYYMTHIYIVFIDAYFLLYIISLSNKYTFIKQFINIFYTLLLKVQKYHRQLI